MFCWICQNQVDKFDSYGVPSRPGKCPHCGAKPRGRLLDWWLREVLRPRLPDFASLLEVGPSRFSVDTLLGRAPLGARPWIMIDRRITAAHRKVHPPHQFLQMDATRLGFKSRSFDLILCNNILPYVEHDRLALGEIARCLKPDGLVLMDTHMDGETTLPVADHRRHNPQLGEDFYAENGDQWVYGKDFYQRVASAGLTCRVARCFEQRPRTYLAANGLKTTNEFLIAFIEPAALNRCLHSELRVIESNCE